MSTAPRHLTVTIESGEGAARTTRSYTYATMVETAAQFWGWVAEAIVFYKGDGTCQGMTITYGTRQIRVGRFDSGQLDVSERHGGKVRLVDGREARGWVAEHRPHLVGRRVA